MAKKTQFHSYMPLTGRRYGSFSGRAPFVPPTGDANAVSFVRQPSAAGQHSRSASSVTAWGHPQFFRRAAWASLAG